MIPPDEQAKVAAALSKIVTERARREDVSPAESE